ncbi:MAG: GNAT family N-acetyltransferase, partial [Clostridia bacterium]|nr:GNAT family N-acetyltransferase [Clostridia bacterium]
MNINTHLYDLPVLDAGDYILRAIETSDAPDIYDYARREIVTRYMLWEAHKSVEDALKFIRFTAELNIDKKNMDWCIVEKSTNRVIGAIGAIVRSPKGEVMELGYVLHPDFWGQGIMPRAARAVRDFIFQNTTCIRLESRHFAENTASGRVMQKIGMTYEG